MSNQAPDPNPPSRVARLRRASLCLAWFAALLATAMVASCNFGQDTGFGFLMLGWNLIACLVVWLFVSRAVSHPAAWSVALGTFATITAVEAYFLYLTVEQLLVQTYGWDIKGVRRDSHYRMISLFVPLYVGAAGQAGFVAAIIAERIRPSAT